tara:strand:- start:73 stop:624 length:552 start_codon:yes stop_codon:yes gene_type:complete
MENTYKLDASLASITREYSRMQGKSSKNTTVTVDAYKAAGWTSADLFPMPKDLKEADPDAADLHAQKRDSVKAELIAGLSKPAQKMLVIPTKALDVDGKLAKRLITQDVGSRLSRLASQLLKRENKAKGGNNSTLKGHAKVEDYIDKAMKTAGSAVSPYSDPEKAKGWLKECKFNLATLVAKE